MGDPAPLLFEDGKHQASTAEKEEAVAHDAKGGAHVAMPEKIGECTMMRMMLRIVLLSFLSLS